MVRMLNEDGLPPSLPSSQSVCWVETGGGSRSPIGTQDQCPVQASVGPSRDARDGFDDGYCVAYSTGTPGRWAPLDIRKIHFSV